MIKRILVALSGTRFTDAVVEHALGLAREHGAELCGVTDIDVGRVADLGPVPIGAGAAAKGLIEHRRRLAEGRVEEVIQRFETACGDADVAYTVHREAGEPFARVMDLWRYCDLTIVGLQGLFEYELIHNPDDVLIQLIATGVRVCPPASGARSRSVRAAAGGTGAMPPPSPTSSPAPPSRPQRPLRSPRPGPGFPPPRGRRRVRRRRARGGR